MPSRFYREWARRAEKANVKAKAENDKIRAEIAKRAKGESAKNA